MAIYRPPFIKQLDGSAFAGENCTIASFAMAACRERQGSNPPGTAPWPPRPAWVRSVMGDRSGGTNLTQNDYIFNKYYGVNLQVALKMAWSTFVQQIRAGRGAVLQGRYSVFHGTKFDGSGTFMGNHAIYVNEVRYNAKLKVDEFLCYDPLWDGRRSGIPKAPQWVGAPLLRKFAGALRLSNTIVVGVGYVYAALTRDTVSGSAYVTVNNVATPTTLKYGAVVYGPKTFYGAVNGGRVRTAPNTSAKINRTLSVGQAFGVHQRTTTGQLVNGSRVWYGSRGGYEWVHSSVVKLTR